MVGLRIYHNPSCSKSRGVLEILQEREIDSEVVEYLVTPLDRDTLASVLERLSDPPEELVRKDKNFAALGLDPGDYETSDAVISLLLAHPELMQRPVVVRGDRAVIARPSEKVLELL